MDRDEGTSNCIAHAGGDPRHRVAHRVQHRSGGKGQGRVLARLRGGLPGSRRYSYRQLLSMSLHGRQRASGTKTPSPRSSKKPTRASSRFRTSTPTATDSPTSRRSRLEPSRESPQITPTPLSQPQQSQPYQAAAPPSIRQRCAGCHGGNGGNLVPTSLSLSQLVATTANGGPAGMPSFSGTLTSGDIQLVAEYLFNWNGTPAPTTTTLPGIVPDGAAVWSGSCAGCHGSNGGNLLAADSAPQPSPPSPPVEPAACQASPRASPPPKSTQSPRT